MGKGIQSFGNQASVRTHAIPAQSAFFSAGGGNQNGRGPLRGCASTQAPIPGREAAKVGGGVRGPIPARSASRQRDATHERVGAGVRGPIPARSASRQRDATHERVGAGVRGPICGGQRIFIAETQSSLRFLLSASGNSKIRNSLNKKTRGSPPGFLESKLIRFTGAGSRTCRTSAGWCRNGPQRSGWSESRSDQRYSTLRC